MTPEPPHRKASQAEGDVIDPSSLKPSVPVLPLAQRRPSALYLHLPFCARVCPYCDFAVSGIDRALEERYLDALQREIRNRLPEDFRPQSIFLGGGTPTELRPENLERLGTLLAPFTGEAREVSIEANPGTLTPRKIAALEALRVNRVSLGSQSLNDALLETLGRVHRAKHTYLAVERLREAGFRSINLDLIFAIPGQSLEDLELDIKAYLALKPDHISAYGLTFEPGTPFESQRQAGRLRAAPNALEARMLQRVRRRLIGAGFRHYEISNYARPGHACAHNRVYWRNGSYIGVGNGAASHLGGRRSTNLRSVEAYIAAIHDRGHAVAMVERLSHERKVAETAYLALRSSRGLCSVTSLRDLGLDIVAHFAPQIKQMVDAGLMLPTTTGARLTARGVALADSVVMEFL